MFQLPCTDTTDSKHLTVMKLVILLYSLGLLPGKLGKCFTPV